MAGCVVTWIFVCHNDGPLHSSALETTEGLEQLVLQLGSDLTL